MSKLKNSKVDRSLSCWSKFASLVAFLMPAITIAVLNTPLVAKADSLSQVGIYSRCYAQMVRTSVPANDPLLAKVKAGTLAAVDACMQVLNLGELDVNNNLANTTDPRSPQVLKTFLNFFRSWFPENNFALQLPEAAAAADQDIYDPNTPAYFPTHALFAPNGQFKEIVTASVPWQAVRTPKFANGSGMVNNVGVDGNPFSAITFMYRTGPALNALAPWVPAYFVSRGTLTGFKTPAALPFTTYYINQSQATQPAPNNKTMVSIDASQSLGGGVLGVPSYFMLTSGRLVADIPDGGRLMTRLWSLSFYKDLLGRTAPLLRNGDVTSFVQPQSTLPFRNSSSCMQCHATLDGAAATARNTIYLPDNVPQNLTNFNSLHLYTFTPTNKPVTPPSQVDFDASFFLEQPQGLLYYRAYDGTLINQQVTGVQALGQALAQTNDLYFCAANRLFNFFTGISIYVGDYGDPSAPTPTATELTNRNFIIQLGQQLKQTQSLTQVIKTILSSPYYGQSDYGQGGGN